MAQGSGGRFNPNAIPGTRFPADLSVLLKVGTVHRFFDEADPPENGIQRQSGMTLAEYKTVAVMPMGIFSPQLQNPFHIQGIEDFQAGKARGEMRHPSLEACKKNVFP